MENNEIKVKKEENLLYIQNQFLKFEFNLSKGTFSIYDLINNSKVISSALYGVSFRNRREDLLKSNSKKIYIRKSSELSSFDYSCIYLEDKVGKGKQLKITSKNNKVYPELTLIVNLYQKMPFLILQEIVKNNSTSSHQIKYLLPLIISKDSSYVQLGGQIDEWSFYKQGWQSWSPTYSLKISKGDVRPKLGIARLILESYTEKRDKLLEFLSEGMTVLKDLKSDKSILLGFTTFFNQLTTIRFKIDNLNRGKFDLEGRCDAEDYILEPEEELSSERLMIDFSPPEEALKNYAQVVSQEMEAIKREEIPVGWCSWYYYFNKIKAEDIEENLKVIALRKEEVPLQFFQIDDGYEQEVGDWLRTNKKFPEGLKSLAKKIKAAGFKPGIWVAPFIIRAKSSIYKEHPDWILRDKNGKKVVAGINHMWGGIYYALDTTHPEVQEHLRKLFKSLREFGFEFIKIDFIFAAALPGEHFDEQKTRVQAYRDGLRSIREGAGDKTFILGCGAPLGPSIGLVDGMRISTDVDPSWQHWAKKIMGEKYVLGAANAMHNTITRYFMHQKFWINDPDCVLVREDKTRLSEEEIKSLITVIGLSGGMVLSSDNHMKLSEKRLRWLTKLIPPSGVSAYPFDLMEKEMPQILILKDEKSNQILVGIINWEDKIVDFTLKLEELKISPGDYHLFDFWKEEYLGIISSFYQLTSISPHGCKLISLKAVQNFPQVIATSFHITCGIIDIKMSYYSAELKQLYFELNINRIAEGKIFIWVPEGFQEKVIFSAAKSYKMYRSSSNNNLLVVEATVEKEATFRIDF